MSSIGNWLKSRRCGPGNHDPSQSNPRGRSTRLSEQIPTSMSATRTQDDREYPLIVAHSKVTFASDFSGRSFGCHLLLPRQGSSFCCGHNLCEVKSRARTVPYPTPRFAEICRRLWPSAFNWRIRSRSTVAFGRPRRLPFARAFRIPALTLSRIKSRSNCATADTIVKSACPNALLVSMFS
jgi:hypothetical protein